MTEFVILAVMAVVWWIPTFRAMTDLQGQQRRHAIPRSLAIKAYLLLTVPVVGWIWYWRRGRARVTHAADARPLS
ncbi:MAG: hypothetical protein ACRD29_02330 [Acidimicrobiales bacterium]